ncbi:hypothetical protein SDC9_139494 [bioreactor metagenome]|uniref:Uncharacterized protein n=1 Tax=bioreactor metagenome TaxID=1076179 RepID=A0A645DSV3_9ZZZZ
MLAPDEYPVASHVGRDRFLQRLATGLEGIRERPQIDRIRENLVVDGKVGHPFERGC